jgi:hypothetical protein
VSRSALPLVVRFGERAIYDLPESATISLETDADRRALDPALPIGGQVQAHAQLWLGVN